MRLCGVLSVGRGGRDGYVVCDESIPGSNRLQYVYMAGAADAIMMGKCSTGTNGNMELYSADNILVLETGACVANALSGAKQPSWGVKGLSYLLLYPRHMIVTAYHVF